jgi:hypothetical protein
MFHKRIPSLPFHQRLDHSSHAAPTAETDDFDKNPIVTEISPPSSPVTLNHRKVRGRGTVTPRISISSSTETESRMFPVTLEELGLPVHVKELFACIIEPLNNYFDHQKIMQEAEHAAKEQLIRKQTKAAIKLQERKLALRRDEQQANLLYYKKILTMMLVAAGIVVMLLSWLVFLSIILLNIVHHQ